MYFISFKEFCMKRINIKLSDCDSPETLKGKDWMFPFLPSRPNLDIVTP